MAGGSYVDIVYVYAEFPPQISASIGIDRVIDKICPI